MFWIIRRVGNDAFWQIVDGPFLTAEEAFEKIEEWHRSSAMSASFNLLNMVVMK